MNEASLLKKPIFWLILIFTLAFGAVFSLPDEQLNLVFCDVGQGDAIFISHKSTQVLIDGGPDNKVLNCLSEHMPFYDRQIEMVVLTHPQSDHYSGLIDVIQRYNISQFVINSIFVDSAGFREFYRAILAEGAPVYSPKAGDKINVGQVQLLVLWPKEKLGDEKVWLANAPSSVLGAATYFGETNDTSIVLKVSYGSFDALLAGDISFDTEERLDLAPVEVLKIAHHGSKYSTGKAFLNKIKPVLAVISVGKNSYGHPTEEVLKRLTSLGIKFLRTDKEGKIIINSDGRRFWFKQGIVL